ncbi:hypothetical protein D3C73_835930 [compost metagenome]
MFPTGNQGQVFPGLYAVAVAHVVGKKIFVSAAIGRLIIGRFEGKKLPYLRDHGGGILLAKQLIEPIRQPDLLVGKLVDHDLTDRIQFLVLAKYQIAHGHLVEVTFNEWIASEFLFYHGQTLFQQPRLLGRTTGFHL